MGKVIISGATGFIGRHLVERFLTQGQDVTILTRNPARAFDLFGEKVEVLKVDMRQRFQLPEGELLINLAGAIKARNYREFWEHNVLSAENLVKAAEGKIRYLIHASSQAAAGPSFDCKPVKEDQARPVSSYGRSKLEGERRISSFSGDKLILRIPAVYGPYDKGFLPAFKIIKKRVIPLVGGDSEFSIIYVSDLVEIILRLIDKKATGIVNVATSTVTYREFSERSCQILTGKKPIFVKVPLFMAKVMASFSLIYTLFTGEVSMVNPDKVREIYYPCWILSTEKLRSLLGEIPRTPFQEALNSTIQWYKKQGWL